MNNVVLVFGSGRSGTSWLCETMAQPRGYRLLFEPEHPEFVPEGRILADQLLIPGSNYPEVDDYLKRVFANRIDNDWIAQNSNRRFKMHLWPFLIRKKVAKFIRCNLSMCYISGRFNIPAVYIKRSPFSAIYSQNRSRFPWLYDLSRFTAQHDLVDEVKKRYDIDLLKSNFTELETLAIRWGIENIFSIQYFQEKPPNSKIISVEYEELSGNMELYLDVISRVGLKAPPNIEKAFNRPSSKTHPKSNIRKGTSADYEKLFIASQRREIGNILRLFDPKYA